VHLHWRPARANIVDVYGRLNNNGVIHFSGDLAGGDYGVFGWFDSNLTNNGNITFDSVNTTAVATTAVFCQNGVKIDGSGSICATNKVAANSLCYDCSFSSTPSMCSSNPCPQHE